MVSDAPGWGTDLNGEAVIARPWKDNIPLCLKAVVGTTRVGHFDFEPSPSVHHHLPVRKALGWESATIALWKPEGDRNSCARSQQGPDPVIHMHDQHLFTGDILCWNHRRSEFERTDWVFSREVAAMARQTAVVWAAADTAEALVPGGRSGGGAVPSVGWAGQARLPDAGAGAAGGGGGHGGVCDGGRSAGLDRGAVGSGLHGGRRLHAAAAAADPAQDAAAPAHEGGPPGPGGLEKGELAERLAAAGLKAGQGIVWGDERRVGLRGQVGPRAGWQSPKRCRSAGSTSMWRSPSIRGRGGCGGRGSRT